MIDGNAVSAATTIVAEPAELGVVEAFISGKADMVNGVDSGCEDHLVISDAFIAVIDGMSSPLRGVGEAASGGLFAQAIGRAITDLDPTLDAVEAITHLSKAAATVESSHQGPSGAVAAILSLHRREVWRVGDIHVRVDDQHLPGTKLVDEIGSDVRALINSASLADGMSTDQVRETDPGRNAVGPLLRSQGQFANKVGEYGYGVLDGSLVPTEYIEILAVPKETVDVVLASDGFLSAAESLDAAQDELVEALAADPACVGADLRAMGKAAAPGSLYPDDRTYVRVRL